MQDCNQIDESVYKEIPYVNMMVESKNQSVKDFFSYYEKNKILLCKFKLIDYENINQPNQYKIIIKLQLQSQCQYAGHVVIYNSEIQDVLFDSENKKEWKISMFFQSFSPALYKKLRGLSIIECLQICKGHTGILYLEQKNNDIWIKNYEIRKENLNVGK